MSYYSQYYAGKVGSGLVLKLAIQTIYNSIMKFIEPFGSVSIVTEDIATNNRDKKYPDMTIINLIHRILTDCIIIDTGR